MSDVTRILNAIQQGDERAADKLLPLVYEELRLLAAQKMAQEKPGQTLQATALVHEAYIRLVEGADQNWNGRGHFFKAAAGLEQCAKFLESNGHPTQASMNKLADSMNELARFLATSPKADLRNGTRAIEIATRACELTKWDNAQYVDTLAAAYAEADDFDEAIKWQQKAIDLLDGEQGSMYRLEFEARLRLYQAGQSYHRKPLFANQMIAWWKFDETKGETVIDSSGNGLNGKLVGDANIVSDMERGGVLRLDGDGDYVDCGNSTAFNIAREMTVACWIKVHEFNKDWQSIIQKGSWSWRLQRDKRRNNIEFACTGLKVVGEGRNSGSIFGKVDVNDGKWHHVVGVYEGDEICLYVDGTLDNSERASGLIETNDFAVMIGENAEKMVRGWNGLIDDVRIYSYALTEDEVKEVYAGHGPGPNKRPE